MSLRTRCATSAVVAVSMWIQYPHDREHCKPLGRRVPRHILVTVWKQLVPGATVSGMNADKIMQAIGAEVRAEAAAQKIPMTRLAEAAGIGRVTLYRYLDATRDMPVAVLLDLSAAVGVGADVLMTRAQERVSRDAEGLSDGE